MYLTKLKEEFIRNNSTSQNLVNIIKENIDLVIFALFFSFKLFIFRYSLNLSDSNLYFISSIGSVLLVCSLFVLIPKKFRIKLIIGFDIMLSILLFADATYFSYYRTALSVGNIFQIKLITPSMGASITHIIRLIDILLFVDIGILIYIKYKKKVMFEEENVKKRLTIAFLFFAIGITFTTNAFVKKSKFISNQDFNILYNNENIIANIGVINYHGLDLYSFFKNNVFKKNELTTAEKDYINNKVLNSSTSKSNVLTGSQEGKNLIILQVEAMQNIFIDMEVNGNEVTPFLNKFKESCMYYDNFYAQTGVGNTSDAEFLVNNSLFPINYGSVYYRYHENTYNALPKFFNEKDYYTFVVHGNKGDYWNRNEMYPSYKFDKFYTRDDLDDGDLLGEWGISDKSMLNQSFNIINSRKEPFYSFLITVSSHFPFSTFDDFNNIDTGKYENTFYGNYIKSMHYADMCIGNFINKLKSSGILDNSVLILYGDHGGFDENNLIEFMEQNGIKDYNKDVELFKTKNVPLFIHLADEEKKGTDSSICGQIDIMPTITNLYNFDAKYVFGTDILNERKDYIKFTNGNITDGKSVYINSLDTYYDLESSKRIKAPLSIKDNLNEAKENLLLSNSIIENNLLEYFNNNFK